MKKITFAAVAIALMVIPACKKKPACDGSAPNYTSTVRSIVNSNCTSSGCHPTYNTYQGLKPILDNGQFKREVLERQSMPRGRNLSKEDLNKLQCWVENGYPEN